MFQTNNEYHHYKPFIILLVGIALFILSNGRWSVPFAAWIAPVFLLQFVEFKKPLQGLTILFVLIAVSTRIMLYGIIPSHLGLLTYILTVYYAVLWFLPYLAHRIAVKKSKNFVMTLVFPITGVTFEFINNLLYGSWASVAYTQFENLSFIQISSIAGIWGVTFIVMWFGSVVNWIINYNFEYTKIRKGLIVFSTILTLSLLYGGIRLAVYPPSTDTITVASFTASQVSKRYFEEIQKSGYNTSIDMARDDRLSQSTLLKKLYDDVFKKNKEIISTGASITLWPEAGIRVLEEDEGDFVRQGQEFSQAHSVYLLMAYLVIPRINPGRLGENKSVFINPNGEVEWEYLKTYPVPGSPNKPGNGVIPVSHTPIGKISSVICYDMDFTMLLNKAGKADIDIMLVPAWDWKAIDPLHARMAVFRAIENGFSMVRQTGEGLSIAVDYQGRTLSTMDHFKTENHTMISHIPKKGVKTMYSIVGDTFAWLCSIVFLIGMGIYFIHVLRRP